MKREETFQAAFRLPVSLMAKIDAYAEMLSKQAEGALVSRTDAARILLEKALADFEPATKPKRGKNA